MKKTTKFLSVLLVLSMMLTIVSVSVSAQEVETVILYTNDVHCAIDDYPVLAAYRAELMAQGKNVVTVDAGDAIQGEVIGSITKGEAVVDIMNAVGYDYAVPGNHEFDYGMETFLDLAQNNHAHNSADDAAVDGQATLPNIEDSNVVGCISIPLENAVVKPGAEDRKGGDPQDAVHNIIFLDAELLGASAGINDRKEQTAGNDQTVVIDAERADGKAPSGV